MTVAETSVTFSIVHAGWKKLPQVLFLFPKTTQTHNLANLVLRTESDSTEDVIKAILSKSLQQKGPLFL